MFARIFADGAGGQPRIVIDYNDNNAIIWCDGSGGRPKNGCVVNDDAGDVLDE